MLIPEKLFTQLSNGLGDKLSGKLILTCQSISFTFDFYMTFFIMGADEQFKEEVDIILRALQNPGPDLLIIDEGSNVKNSKVSFSFIASFFIIIIIIKAKTFKSMQARYTQAVSSVATKRKIILTGRPIQNNLREYFTLVSTNINKSPLKKCCLIILQIDQYRAPRLLDC